MPTNIFTPGPIFHYVRFRNASTIHFLGTAVAAPEQDGEKFKIPVMNDLGGRSVPFQLIQDGEIWNVTTTLNRFDLLVARAVRSLESGRAPTVPPAAGVLGSETSQARGTLNIGVSDFELFLVNGYAGTPAAGTAGTAAAELNRVRGFASCNLRRYKESTVGTRVLEVAMAIECQNMFTPTGANPFGFVLYQEGTVAGIPNPN